MPKGIDYSKWDSVELSDDDSDCHPNIEKDFWLRIKKEKRDREKEDNAKEVVGLQKAAKEKREEADRAEEAMQAADEVSRKEASERAESLRKEAAEAEAKASKIIESERKRNWEVHDKFNHTEVNMSKLELKAPAKPKKKAADTPEASTGAGEASGSASGAWEVIHEPGEGAAAPAEEEDGEEDEEAALQAYVHDMEMKAQELGVLGNDEDCFETSWEVIKKYPEIAVKETTDYLLLVGNDLAKKGEEDLGRAFVHQSLMMQYCMDLSAGGANGVAQFFKRMNAPDDSVRRKARGHFESELDEYWGKILARARRIRQENEGKAKQEEMKDALKPPENETAS
mmetsp:Transcript_6365/g.17228  ORF Transcript_6365/g.17228 Transcript_6365/m.17228 type:complete len:341 (+) Transcript_6365:50-1072(+)